MSRDNEREAKVILTADNKQYNKGIEESQKATEKLNKALEKTSESAEKIVKKTSKGLLKIGAGEIAGLTALSAIAAKLDKQTSNIQANLALNKSASQFNAVTGSIRAMSREIPMARAEIAGMATEVSNLGFVSGSQISKVTSQFSRMGIATGESPAALAQNMVQFQRAMGTSPSAETMEPYQNATTYLSARAGVPANDILSFAGSVAPAARVAGMDQSSVLGLSAAATRSGADGRFASSTIQQILNDITMLRYSKSPEMKRYSTALGIPLEELTGEVSNKDKFNRNIISKVLETSQKEEGPTNLSLLGFDGLRAKKALQMMASESGGIGVERWISEARHGMGTESVDVGFKAASDGLADELVMLRNRFTDVGQVVGEPTMKGFTLAATGANKAAEKLQFFTDAITKFLGLVTGPLALATMSAGAMYGAWKTFSTVSLLKRGTYNVGTSALGSGFVSGQGVARGADPNIPVNRMAANVMSGDPMRASGFQRTVFGIGSAAGTMLPNARITGGPFQKLLGGIDRLSHFVSTGTTEWYRRAAMSPEDRYADRMEGKRLRGFSPTDRATNQRLSETAQSRANEWARRMGRTGYDAPAPRRVPYMDDYQRPDRYTVSGVGRRMVGGFIRAPWEATKFAAQEAGGKLPLAGNIVRSIGTDLKSGLGAGIAGGIGSMARMAMSPQMLAMVGMAYGMKTYSTASEDTARWGDTGKGFDGEIINTMTTYNEKLGLATTSLQRFASAVDEANPAKTENLVNELSADVFTRGSAADYEMVDERVKAFVQTPESAKRWISSQGEMNADQAVTVFADLANLMSRSEWTDLRDYYLAGTGGTGKPSSSMINEDFGALATSLAQSTQDSMSGFQKAGSIFGQLIEVGAFDPAGIRGNPESNQAAADYISMPTQIGAYIGETKDASDVVGGTLSATDKSTTLSRSVEFAKVYESIVATLDEFEKSETSAARASFFNVKNRADEMLDVDLSGINAVAGETDTTREELWKRFYSQAVLQSENDPILKQALDSGLISSDQTMAGMSTADFIASLEDKKVTTSVDAMIDSSKFKNLSEDDREKWFGETSVLKDLGTGISDPIKQLAASFKMLQLAQEKYGDTVTSTDYALQSMKSGLSPSDSNWGLVTGAQQLNQLLDGQFADAGGGPEYRIQSRSDRVDAAIKDAGADINASDSQERLLKVFQENAETVINIWTKVRQAEKQYQRSNEDFYEQLGYQAFDFALSQTNAEADFQRQTQRSKDAYHRQLANSEAAFYRGRKYQRQDFHRSVMREEEQHARQLKYAAEDTAKSIGDPYNRLQLQLLNDPASMQVTMQNRVDIASRQNRNLDDLRGRGLSDEAVQQLDLANFTNAQQTSYFANTATDSDIAEFNKIAKEMVKQGSQLNKEQPGTIRAEKERSISIEQSMEDFIRSMKRAKVEHVIQVDFSQKEFRIGLKISASEHEIAMDRAKDAFGRSVERSKNQFEKSIRRQKEDLEEYFEAYATTQEEMVEQTSKSLKALGLAAGNVVEREIKRASKDLNRLKKKIEEIGEISKEINWTEIQDAYDQSRRESSSPSRRSGGGTFEGRGSSAGGGGRAASVSRALNTTNNEYGMCLNQVSKWIGNAPRGVPNALTAWSISKKKHRGDRNPPPGYPVYWGGGPDGHVALSVGGGRVRSTDWPKARRTGTVGISTLTKAWGKPYYGWTEDAWGGRKLAQGGIAQAKPGGVKATIAEAGSHEAVIPLDKRGVDFMTTFTKGVAREMIRSMPKTPVTNTVNSYDHSTNVSIETVELASSDPKKFVRELQQEASKKRAALYKGPLSGVSA